MIGRTNTGGGGTGATMTVNAPAGAVVTVSKDGKTKTKTAGADGVAVFKGLATGQWTVTITDGEQTAQKTVTITADYSTAITFFSATIHVTYPAGSTCTATDGVTTLTAPDTSGTWECVVPNAGTWTVSCDDLVMEVNIASEGQTENVNLRKYWLFKSGEGDKVGLSKSSESKASVSITTDAIKFASNLGVYGLCACCTDNQIDLTNYTKLCCEAKIKGASNGNWPPKMGISTVKIKAVDKDVFESYQVIKSSAVKLFILDISAIEGSYYIGFHGFMDGSITNFWLDK